MKRLPIWLRIAVLVYWAVAHAGSLFWLSCSACPFDRTVRTLVSVLCLIGAFLIPILLREYRNKLRAQDNRDTYINGYGDGYKKAQREAITKIAYAGRRSDRQAQKAEETGRQKGREDGYAEGLAAGAKQADANYYSGLAAGLSRGTARGIEQGFSQGLAQGRKEGFSLGHSEGYKYALYTQNRFQYYNDDPPLTYEEARRSLDEGTDGANGELIEPEPPAPPTRAPGKKRRSRKKKPEPAPEPTTAAHEEPNDEELDRLFQEVKENYERNGFKLNTSDGYEYDAAGFDRNGLDRNGFTRDGLGSNGMLPYREPDKPATDMMSRLRREGLQGDPYLWDAPGDEDDAEEIAWPNYAERPTEEAALSNIE